MPKAATAEAATSPAPTSEARRAARSRLSTHIGMRVAPQPAWDKVLRGVEAPPGADIRLEQRAARIEAIDGVTEL